jgi:nucleotide-binding universal stress UspA family protein
MDDESTPRAAADPGGQGGTGTIVVGVDGSEASVDALRWAVAEARLRGARVVAVHAWLFPDVVLRRREPPPGYEELRRSAQEVLDAALESVAETAAGVDVERRVVEGVPSEQLVAAAEGADMLVLGSRGLGGFAGLLLGSVSQQCAHHARCPVVIVHHGERGEGSARAGGGGP